MTDTEDLVALQQLHSLYADIINRRAWSELTELFEPDATIRVDTVTRPAVVLNGPGELGTFIGSAVERFEFFEFVVLNCRIGLRADGDNAADSRVFMCEIRRDRDGLDWSVAYGVYQDRCVRAADGWRFARREYQSLTRTDGEVFPPPVWMPMAIR